jgi:flagellar secretion chaperone FliS
MNIYEAYRESQIVTADPIRLTELLYRGAMDATRQARGCLRAGEIEARGRAISKASAILIELAASLDRDSGGEVARNLAELYVYMLGRLSTAHIEQREEPLLEVEKLIGTLLEGWTTLNVAAEPAVPADLYTTPDVEAERFSCTY